jgi:hypothetical protein
MVEHPTRRVGSDSLRLGIPLNYGRWGGSRKLVRGHPIEPLNTLEGPRQTSRAFSVLPGRKTHQEGVKGALTITLRMSNIFIDGIIRNVNDSITIAATNVTHSKEVAAIALHDVR